MRGTYNLISEKIDLHGTLKTVAEVSKTTHGIKSLMLKVLDPFFKNKPRRLPGSGNYRHLRPPGVWLGPGRSKPLPFERESASVRTSGTCKAEMIQSRNARAAYLQSENHIKSPSMSSIRGTSRKKLCLDRKGAIVLETELIGAPLLWRSSADRYVVVFLRGRWRCYRVRRQRVASTGAHGNHGLDPRLVAYGVISGYPKGDNV